MILTIAWQNLRRRPARSLLTVAGIATVICGAVAITSLARGFEATWLRVYAARGADLTVFKRGGLRAPAFSAEQPNHVIGSLPGVRRVAAVLYDTISIETAPLVMVFGFERSSFVWDHLQLVEGRWPQNDSDVVIGSIAAEVLGKHVGSTMTIERSSVRVSGIFDSSSIIEKGAVVMTLEQLQRLLDQPGKVISLHIQLQPGATDRDVDEVRHRIETRLSDLRAYTPGETVNSNTAVNAARTFSAATTLIAMLVGAVGVTNTMLMSVLERVREIGVLLAVGWRRGRVLLMILVESLALSMAGGAVGIAAGILVVRGFETGLLLRGKLEGATSATVIVVGLSTALGLGIIGGLYPAWRGSALKPIEALRCE